MFNVGGGEVLVILLVALLVLGPNKLPEAARQVGQAMGHVRRLSSGFQRELREAMDDVDHEPDRGPRLPPAVTAQEVDESQPQPQPEPEPEPEPRPVRRPAPRAGASGNGEDAPGLPPPPPRATS